MSYIWVVPDGGGMFGYEDYFGNTVIWKAWTNYPAPWWNRWWWFIDTDDENYGPCDGGTESGLETGRGRARPIELIL